MQAPETPGCKSSLILKGTLCQQRRCTSLHDRLPQRLPSKSPFAPQPDDNLIPMDQKHCPRCRCKSKLLGVSPQLKGNFLSNWHLLPGMRPFPGSGRHPMIPPACNPQQQHFPLAHFQKNKDASSLSEPQISCPLSLTIPQQL